MSKPRWIASLGLFLTGGLIAMLVLDRWNAEPDLPLGEDALRQGLAEFSAQKYEAAIQSFTEAIRGQPNEANLYYCRALAYDRIDDHAAAIQDYSRALALDPDDARVFNNRGNVFQKQGDFTRAIDDYTRAIVLKPNEARAYYNRGRTFRKQGRLAKALDDLNNALALEPGFKQALVERARLEREAGQWGLARADLEAALESDPDFSLAIQELAWTLAVAPEPEVRHPELALKFAEEARKRAADDDYISLDVWAAALAAMGQFEAAVQRQEEALSRAPAERRSDLTARLQAYRQRQTFTEPRKSATDAP